MCNRFAKNRFAKYHFAKYHFAKYRFAKYRFAKYHFVSFRFAKYRKPLRASSPFAGITRSHARAAHKTTTATLFVPNGIL